MPHAVVTRVVAADTIVAVRRRVKASEIATAWKPALDQVWAFLRAHADVKRGHNLFLYRHQERREHPMEVDFGVQVASEVEGEGEVRCVRVPAGEVATTTHVGSYAGIPAAHATIHAWQKTSGRSFAGWSWELYGDWQEDESKLETTIFYLLEA